ncbi:hypothetical protein GRI55_14555 [Erythrobacter citreus]|uniref:UDP-N-acetylglucosamine 2-epimerase domain-containing protein n=1 Tax=Qipengyuania citrea TaxID=225971 RepID=A0A6I4UGH8_9SPHN|nr:hypothetical protein [Qipengyuania citrea]MDQ0564867.1 hypothetical protein [Qipengyuania citrea]MXP36954.1 hypothetical protein [Qipengyuania citrea]
MSLDLIRCFTNAAQIDTGHTMNMASYDQNSGKEMRTPNDMMCEYIGRLADFFGRPRYKNFHRAVAAGRLSHKLFYSVAHILVRSRVGSFAGALFAYFFLGSLRRIPNAEVVLFGETKNNQKANAEVADIIRDQFCFRILVADRSATLFDRLCRLKSISYIWRAKDQISNIKGLGPFAAAQLLVGAAAYAFYAAKSLPSACRVVVFSNDHSPVPTALMYAVLCSGRKSVYRQHAPVTSEFPPLRYDLAILHDQVSRDAYRVASRRLVDAHNCFVTILSPFRERGRPMRISDRIVKIGICLSLVWNVRAVELLIDELQKIPSLSQILIRPHPGNRQNLAPLLERAGVDRDEPSASVEVFANLNDIVIVPNSGICLELLHYGVPVSYQAGLDALGHDLYGFVKSRIVIERAEKVLPTPEDLKAFYDYNWRHRFKNYDATQFTSPEEMLSDVSSALKIVI